MRVIGFALGVMVAGVLAGAACADPAAPAPPQAAAAPAAPRAAPLTVTRPDAEMMARRAARRAARLDKSLDAARAGLKLDANQDALWRPVADALHGLDTARGIGFRQEMATADSSIDGLELQGDHMARMGAAMSRLAHATKPLVASLTPEQKSRLPALLQDMTPRKIVDRAFEVPQDEAGAWGTGQAGAGKAAAGRPGAGAAATPAKAGAAGPDDPQDRNDEE